MEVGGEDGLGAGEARELDEQEADGPASQHRHDRGNARRRQVHRVQCHAERLEQRPPRVAHAGGQGGEEMRGMDQPLAQCAGNAGRAHETDARADMGMAIDTELALAAGNGGIDGHAFARSHPDHPRAHRLHDAGELVAHHEAALERVRPAGLAPIVVEVGAADAHRGDAHEGLAGTGLARIGHGDHLERARPHEGEGLHALTRGRRPAAAGRGARADVWSCRAASPRARPGRRRHRDRPGGRL